MPVSNTLREYTTGDMDAKAYAQNNGNSHPELSNNLDQTGNYNEADNDSNISIDDYNDDNEDDAEDDEEDEFYTPGPEELYNIRVDIAKYSLDAANKRLESQYAFYKNFDETQNLIERRNYYDTISKIKLQGSQLISNRFTSSICYNSNLSSLAVGSWDGSCYFVNPSTLSIDHTLQKLHNEKLSGLDWFTSNDSNILATGGADNMINIITNPLSQDKSDVKISKLIGHLSRINDLKFHQMSPLVMSASSDLTWRLWDYNKLQEIYYQEGHTDSVNSISVHPDGSILASAGSDSIIKLWDLRSGKLIMDLQTDGHIKSVHALDWRSNGFQLGSGGADSQLIIWDIRKGKKLNSVLAHSKLISKIKFSNNDKLLTSVGYDGSLSLTSCDNWIVFKKFTSSDKIMALEFFNSDSNDSSPNIVTGGWDRSIKLYNNNSIL